MMNKLKLTLITRKLNLLYLASYTFCLYIIKALNKPITLKLRTFFYFNRTTTAILTRGLLENFQ